MTFSDSRIVETLKNDFIPVWEAVAPVHIVTFDLGEGRSVKGTVSGEIALFFCTPEGKVFDILPALQSPAATYNAIQDALAFYQKHGPNPDTKVVRDFHRKRLANRLGKKYDSTDPRGLQQLLVQLPKDKKAESALTKRQNTIKQSLDAATADMRRMMLSKVVVIDPQPILVVEPGGRGYFQFEIGKRFCSSGQWRFGPQSQLFPDLKEVAQEQLSGPPLRTPDEWKKELFVSVLKQPLKGGEATYDSDSLEAIRIIQE